MPSPEVATKSESPNTTTRVSGFGPSAASPGLAGSVDGADTAAAIDTGPFLSPFASSSDTWPDVNSAFTSDSAQLLGLVSTKVCAM